MLKDCKGRIRHSNLPGKPAAGVFLQGKRQLYNPEQQQQA